MRFKFLIAIGFTSLLASQAAAAQCPEDDIAARLIKLEPVSSHYTKEVLKRADEGIANANKSEDVKWNPIFQTFIQPEWLRIISSAMTAIIDTRLRLIQESIDFRQHTACLNIDLLILEAKMEQVRCELNKAVKEDSVNVKKVSLLNYLLDFLNERYRNLIVGANDPLYKDLDMQRIQFFDDPTTVWCAIMYGIEEKDNYTCKRMPEADCVGQGESWSNEKDCWSDLGGEGEGTCPFHSDYLPPTIYGYGCDYRALEDFKDFPLDSVATERDAIEELTEARDRFIDQAKKAKQVFDKVNEITNTPAPDLTGFGMGHSKEREHKKEFGCLEGENKTSIIYSFGGTKWAKRGPFSIEKDEPRLMREFMYKRAQWGAQREHPDFAKLPLEFEGDQKQKEREAFEFNLNDIVKGIRQWWYRTPAEERNIEQAKKESSIVAKASDAQLQINDSFISIRNKTKELAELASDLDKGGRNFTRALALFLRRSCVFRPCNKQLDVILKIVLQDECFPYTNGEFKGDPDIKKICKEAAKL